MGVESPVRVLALWSPDWPVTAAARAARVPPDRPAAVVVANRVLACSAVARARGVRRGLRRREAQARCPDLAVLTRDTDRDARLFEPVVAAVEELAPGVEVVRPGLLVLAAQGPTGYFGGEQEAAERLLDQVAARAGAECQVGVADGLFAAVLAARRGVAVEAGRTPAFLAPLGVEELDREPDADRCELVGLLRRLGLRTLGAFAALDAGNVASRFGADAVRAHRLARGQDPRPPLGRRAPEELSVEVELDPPVDRVDAAAFAARGLAERLHASLAGHGLSCTRLGVVARTVSGRELLRVWRCAEPLTPAGTVDRVRWQLDAWLTQLARRGSPELAEDAPGSGGVSRLRLVPEETVAAGVLQLGLWGDVGETDERAGRALVRVQALLGPEAVVTAVLVGGRDPAEQVRLVPWGDDRQVVAPAAVGGPGTLPQPGGAPVLGEPEVGIGGREVGIARLAGTPSGPLSTQDGVGDPAGSAGAGMDGGGSEGGAGGAGSGGAGAGAGGAGSGGAGAGAGGAGSAVVAAWSPARGVPAGWPQDVVRAVTPRAPLAPGASGTGTGGGPAGGESVGAMRAPRRSAPRRSGAAGRPVPDPPPSWPGRLPAPSPAVVPPEPLPAELTDSLGHPVRLAAPDLLTTVPCRVTVDGGRSYEISGWAGPWPLRQRWWAPDGVDGSRLQVACVGGAALLLLARGGRWWVTGVYD